MASKIKDVIYVLLIAVTLLNIAADVFGIQPQHQTPPATKNALFPVLFESQRVLVVRKPHGISHHDEPLFSRSAVDLEGNNESISPGVLSLLRNERQQEAQEKGERLYGIHRLDKVTSGILVLAKDATTASTLSGFFARGKIQKVYFGLSSKKPKKKKQGLVQGGMTRSRNKSWKLIRKPKNDIKGESDNFAKTRFFTTGFKTVDIDDSGNSNTSILDLVTNVKTVVMFRPYTGKTHQLRVAAKAMGIPLLGDPIYKDGGGDRNMNSENTVPTTTRAMLHASGLHIPEFLDHAEINIWCPPTFFDDGDDCENVEIEEGIGNHNMLSDSLDMTVGKLMTKNCDVPGISEQFLMQQQDRQR